MIQVEFTPGCREIMDAIGLTATELSDAVNNRTCATLDEGVTRIIGATWHDDKIIFFDGNITDGSREASQMSVSRVQLQIALQLSDELPTGQISEKMKALAIFDVVAAAFGAPLRCHRQAPFLSSFDGPYENGVLEFNPPLKRSVGVIGTFLTAIGECQWVWAFVPDRYLSWYEEWQGGSVRSKRH